MQWLIDGQKAYARAERWRINTIILVLLALKEKAGYKPSPERIVEFYENRYR